MPMLTDLQSQIQERIDKNKAHLVAVGIEYSMFEPTITGLKKAILDATRPVRSHFESESFHFFDKQGQGDEHKEIKTAHFVKANSISSTKVSLYRPKTKRVIRECGLEI